MKAKKQQNWGSVTPTFLERGQFLYKVGKNEYFNGKFILPTKLLNSCALYFPTIKSRQLTTLRLKSLSRNNTKHH